MYVFGLQFVSEKYRNFMEKWTVLGLIVVLAITLPSTVAYADESLTDIFTTKAFQGSWEVINKFNWVGFLLNFAISAICILGLASIFIQKMVTLLYLSSRNFFDTVYEVKQQSKGTAFFGFKGLADNISKGNVGVGFDAIVGVFYSVIPNIKAYSDFNPERMQYGLKEDDNVATYMLKTLLPTVLLIFFFSMGFNGTLAKTYGMVVNGFSAAADRVVDMNAEAVVNRIFSAGEKYTFTLGSNNTPEGELAEKIAKSVYSKVLARLDILDTETRMLVGKNVETWVWDRVLGGSWANAKKQLEAIVNNFESNTSSPGYAKVISDSDVKALSYEIIVNTDTTSKFGVSANIRNQFLGSNVTSGNTTADSLTIHLIIRKDREVQADFFVRPNSSTR